MELPSLPTDNLYKFMAIGGVALIIGGFVLPLTQITRDSERVTDTVIAANEEWVKHMDAAVKGLDEWKQLVDESAKITSSLEKLAKEASDPVATQSVPADLKELQQSLWDSKMRHQDQRMKIVEASNQYLDLRGKYLSERDRTLASERDVMGTRIQSFLKLSLMMLQAGSGLMSVGFVLWYWKVQRFHDRLIRAEAEKAEQDLNNPPQPVAQSTTASVSAPLLVADAIPEEPQPPAPARSPAAPRVPAAASSPGRN